MADPTSIPAPAAGPAFRQNFATAREAGARAAVTANEDSAPVRQALRRLDILLSADEGPKQEVPRGFYLNIRV